MLELPLKWKKPQTIFVNSMSDLFHKDVPLAYIQRLFGVMLRAHWHGPELGYRPARPVRTGARAVLLQAVGRHEEEEDGP